MPYHLQLNELFVLPEMSPEIQDCHNQPIAAGRQIPGLEVSQLCSEAAVCHKNASTPGKLRLFCLRVQLYNSFNHG